MMDYLIKKGKDCIYGKLECKVFKSTENLLNKWK